MQGVDYMIANPDLTYEKYLWPHYKHIAGLDEAGRGALAGPVAVGAVILPNDKTLLSRTLAGVRDSKQMTPLERESLAPRIKETALAWSVAFASAEEIDSQGIVRATRLAALRALQKLVHFPSISADRFSTRTSSTGYFTDRACERRCALPEHRGRLRAGEDRSRRVYA